MARVFLSNETYNAATSGAQVFGAAGTEQVNVFSGTTGVSVASSVERVDLSGNIADYTFSSFGAAMTIRDTAGNIVATVSDSGGKSVVFADGALSAAYAGTTLSLGGVALTGTAAAITPAAADIDATTTSDAPASTGGTTGGAAQTFTLTASSPSVTEGDTGTKNLTFTLTLDKAPTEATIINYQALNSTTATAGDDFEIAAGIVTFAAGQTVATVSITVNGDTNFEGDETVQVQFSGGALEAAVTATGTITNDDADPAIGSQSFTLTTGPDGFSGTANSDLFIASDATLSSADVLDGAGGSDVLRYASSGTTGTNESGFSTTGIETAQVTADDTGGTTFDVTGMSGLTTIANNNSSANLTFTGLGSIAAVEMESVSGGNTTVTYKDAALSGLADAQTITLNGNANNAGIAASTLSIGDTSGDGLETLNIATTGAASLLADLVTGAATVNVTGDKNLSIGSTGVLLDGATTVNASAFTGNLSVVLDSNGTGKDVTVTGGAGNDTANFSAGFEADDVFTGGEGIDTLGLTNAIATGTPGGSTTDVEQLSISDAGTGTIDMDNFSGITKVIYDAGFAANATATVDDAVTGLEVELDVTQPVASDGSLVVDLKTDGTSDALTITLDDIGAGEGLALLSAEDAETLNISADDDTTDGTGTLTIAALTATDATAINLSGDAAVTITGTNDPATPVLATLDASAMTDGLTISGTNFAAGGATIKLGSGNDTFNVATMAGADTFDLTAGGNDRIVYNAAAQSSGTKSDTIKGFETGSDVIDATALGTVSSSLFVGNAANSTAAETALTGVTGQAVFVVNENVLVVDADGDGDIGSADLRVTLEGITALTAADLGLGLSGNTITLSAAAATVNATTKTNADNFTTNEDDTINSSIANLVGSTIDGLIGTDALVLSDAGAVGTIGAGVQNVETLTLANGTNTGVQFAATTDFKNVNGGTGSDTIANTANLVAGGDIKLGDGADVVTAFAADLAGTTIDLGDGNDSITSAVGGPITSTLTGGAGTDLLSLINADDISGAAVTGFEDLTLAGGAAVTMTGAQHNQFTGTITAAGAEQITLTDGGTFTQLAPVETYVLANATNNFTISGPVTAITGGTAGDTLNSTVALLDAATGAVNLGNDTGDVLNITGGVTAAIDLAALTGGGAVTGVQTIDINGASTAFAFDAGASNATVVDAAGVTGGGIVLDVSDLAATSIVLTAGTDTLATHLDVVAGGTKVEFGTGAATVADIATNAGVLEFDIDATAGSTTAVTVSATTADFDTGDILDFSGNATSIVAAGAGNAGQVIVTSGGGDSTILWDADGDNAFGAGDIQVNIVGQVIGVAGLSIVDGDLVFL